MRLEFYINLIFINIIFLILCIHNKDEIYVGIHVDIIKKYFVKSCGYLSLYQLNWHKLMFKVL